MKDRKGMTATVDVMIFIVIIGVAVSIMYSVSDNDPEPSDGSSELAEELFSIKIELSDAMDTEDTSVVPLPDILAASLVAGTHRVIDFIETVLDEATGRPSSYRLDLKYGDVRTSIGDGDGSPVSGCSREFDITFGGILYTELTIY